jgi:hypothetical protein
MAIISAFPGTGKTHYYTRNKAHCKDSDSSLFSKDPSFPQNYVENILSSIESRNIQYVLVSTHQIVRQALLDASIPFSIIYPSKFLKKDYLERYRSRGNDESFVKLLEANWETWIDDCEDFIYKSSLINGYRLKKNQFLTDVIDLF